MDRIVSLIERIFYTKLIGSLDLYTILANLFKYIFVIIVMYFIYLIVRMIYLDIEQMPSESRGSGAHLHLITQQSKLPFDVQREYPLYQTNTIGRDASNNIPIIYPYLSGRHATIFLQDGVYYIEDHDSANGTLLNGQKVVDVLPLKNKDILSFVDVEFLFLVGE